METALFPRRLFPLAVGVICEIRREAFGRVRAASQCQGGPLSFFFAARQSVFVFPDLYCQYRDGGMAVHVDC